jgi:hypothetical protein
MKSDSLSRRLAALEEDPEQDMVTVAYQWLQEDGTPAGERIERRVPCSGMFNSNGLVKNENRFFGQTVGRS